MSFFVLGLNHKACPVEIREKLHFAAKQIPEALEIGISKEDIEELVILSTCNRVELYGYTDEANMPKESLLQLLEEVHLIPRSEYQDYLYHHEGKGAINHLFRVTASLDSLVIGENEILGQVKGAFKTAHVHEAVHSLLYRLMEKAIKAGKDIRTQTQINEGAVSVPSVAVELAQKIFGKLSGERVMVLGTGEMSVLALENLKNAGANVVYVVSRNEAHGLEVAQDFEAEWVSIKDWKDCLAEVDILIASTSAPFAIVHKDHVKEAMLKRKRRPLLLIDISVPRNIDSDINGINDVYLYNVDDLKTVSQSNLKLRHREVRKAEDLIEQAVVNYQSWLERLKARPTLERFESFLEDILAQELNRIAPKVNLSDPQRDEVKQRIRNKLLHPPHKKIKEASENGGVNRYLEALHSLFDLEKD